MEGVFFRTKPDTLCSQPRGTLLTSETNISIPPEDFIRSFTGAQRALFLHLLPLVGNSTDADEVLQESNVIILQKWQQFEPGTNFLAWARAIARLEVFRFRRSRHHRLTLLEDDILELVAKRTEVVSNDTAERQRLLSECMGKLRPKDRELIQLRYSEGANGDSVAKALGRPANSVYQSLGRIRRALTDCVNRRLGGMEPAT